VLLGIGGCALVSGALDPVSGRMSLPADAGGIAAGISSGLSYAMYSLMGRSANQRGLNPWTSVFYSFAFAAVILLALDLQPFLRLPGRGARAADLFWLGPAWSGWAVLFALAAVPTVAGFGLYNMSLGLLPASVANLILTLEPPITAVIAYFLLDEVMSGSQIMGAVAILTGVIVLRVHEDRLARAVARAQPAGGGRPADEDPHPDGSRARRYPRTSLLYLIRCGRSASAPRRRCRSAS